MATVILKDVKDNPNLAPKDIQRTMLKDYKMIISYDQAWRAREASRKMIFGNIEESYDHVLSLKYELLNRNIGSHVEVQIGLDRAFERILFPLAFATFEGESSDNWFWFLKNLIKAFNSELGQLGEVSNEAFLSLHAKDKFVWSRRHFFEISKNNYLTNNLSESFNSWILDSRYLPVVDLVDKLRAKLMLKFNKRRKIGLKWKGKLVPYANRYCQEISKNLGSYLVGQTNVDEAEVENEYERRNINLKERTCSCRKWQVTGLLYIHVENYIGIIMNAK
ncbi:uncharacterized protein LOC109841597 [Asparagus officinalis]|uniref:uncharacterized protein LOC109841597 n=1 Tax=Asparagus officinalis TaxID=4686 RepID=UPI00098DEFF3|nr:uncharacterized protein LOC109841597 [Asparagus officinalis]